MRVWVPVINVNVVNDGGGSRAEDTMTFYLIASAENHWGQC